MGEREQMRDVQETILPVVSEAALAGLRRREGHRVVEHRGRYWQQGPPGFYRPVHLAARLTAEEATRPAPVLWGFRACLAERDAQLANAAVPVYLVRDFDDFAESRLTSGRRRKLRRARTNVDLVELTGPQLLREQGYDVFTSMWQRTRYGRLPSREEYLADLEHFGDPARGVVLAALIEGRLGGYLTGYAVDGTAYLNQVVVATWALQKDSSAGLTYEYVYACGRTPGVREMLHGLHAPESASLCRYKEILGFTPHRLPSRLHVLPGLAPVLRRQNPYKYYRMSGVAA